MVISGCARTKVSQQTQALYKRLGFKDKNENGAIEKASFLNIWSNEGYSEEADLNIDGKIVGAEAKFYLWSLSNVTLDEKKQYPISADDKKTLQGLFNENLSVIRSTNDQSLKAAALANTAFKMAEAGLDRNEVYKIFIEALLTSKTIDNPSYKERSATDIAIKMATAKFFKEALETIPNIQGSYLQSKAVGRIIDEIAEAKLDKISLRRLFDGALEMSQRIKDPYYKALVIKDLAVEMAKYGFDKEDTRKAFKEALAAAGAINETELYLRSILINNIVSEMNEAGFEKYEIMKVFCEAGINLL
jgi:hypothetical protein